MNPGKMGRRLMLMLVTALAGGLVTALAVPSAAFADDPAAAAVPARIEVAVQLSTNPRLPDYLTATMVDGKGQALSEQTVTFALGTNFMGQQWIEAGAAITDASGVARLPLNLEDRRYTVRARFADAKGSVLAEAIGEISGPHVPGVIVPDPSGPLAPFSFWMPRLIGFAVVVVWVVLGGVLFMSVRRIRQGRTVIDEG